MSRSDSQNRPELTARQRQALEFIEHYQSTHGYPPTIREIGNAMGIKSTNGVADHLKALKRKGYLVQEGMKSRTLTLSRPSQAAKPSARGRGRGVDGVVTPLIRHTGSIEVPLLGRVAAGEPILAEAQAEGSVVVDRVLLGGAQEVFALKVVGDSMINDGIFDGDFIFVKKRSAAQEGDIVVAMIEGEATVKRYFPEGDRIRFQPANDGMRPIYVHRRDFKDVQILGLVCGVYRQV